WPRPRDAEPAVDGQGAPVGVRGLAVIAVARARATAITASWNAAAGDQGPSWCRIPARAAVSATAYSRSSGTPARTAAGRFSGAAGRGGEPRQVVGLLLPAGERARVGGRRAARAAAVGAR